MQVSPQRALFNRKKRTEKILNSLYKIVGWCALVAMAAALLYVVVERNTVRSKIDSVYREIALEGGGADGSQWSQIKESQPAAYGHEMIEIKHPDQEGSIYAPLDKTNPTMSSMVTQLQKGNWKDVPLTLRLCYPGTASDGKVVRIAGIEGKGWLILLQPTRS